MSIGKNHWIVSSTKTSHGPDFRIQEIWTNTEFNVMCFNQVYKLNQIQRRRVVCQKCWWPSLNLDRIAWSCSHHSSAIMMFSPTKLGKLNIIHANAKLYQHRHGKLSNTNAPSGVFARIASCRLQSHAGCGREAYFWSAKFTCHIGIVSAWLKAHSPSKIAIVSWVGAILRATPIKHKRTRPFCHLEEGYAHPCGCAWEGVAG